MKIEPDQLQKLRHICVALGQRDFSDAELQLIAERIVRFILNAEAYAGEFDRK